MAQVDMDTNQATLDSLRSLRRKLYRIPKAKLEAMSTEDQEKYAGNLHRIGLAILKLEAAMLKGVNDAFKEKEQDLKKAAAALEKQLAALEDAVQVVRVMSEGLDFVANVIALMG
jgi:adenine C2-methylase RlmN of 23S rRNA A2503 and tRNA A37